MSDPAPPQEVPAEALQLTILVPTYRRPAYLERSLRHHLAAFDATGLAFEILVADNASDDETPKVLAEWAARDPRIRPVRQPKNLGNVGNFFYTHRHARGEVMVSVADDDLLVTDTVVAYLERFAASPDLVMIQAPWFLLDETKNNAITGVSYALDEELLFHRGEHARCLDLILSRGIFPELFALRRSAVADVIGPADEAAYHYFATLTHALDAGDVLFVPTPHSIVTAVNRGASDHAGGREARNGWDMYRGGLEYLAARARETQPQAFGDGPTLLQRIHAFTIDRMQMALRLQLSARCWHRAWCLDRRILAYGVSTLNPEVRAELATLASMEAALEEAVVQGCGTVVVAENLFAMYREVIRIEREGLAVVCEPDWSGERDGRTAFIGLGRQCDAANEGDDVIIDLASAIRRFPVETPRRAAA